MAAATRLVEARYPAELDDIDIPSDLERVASELVAVREAMESGQDIWPAAGEKDNAPGELGSSL